MAVTAQGPCSQTCVHRFQVWSGVGQDHCHLTGVVCIPGTGVGLDWVLLGSPGLRELSRDGHAPAARDPRDPRIFP